ncbi:hypothetical protein [Spirosoma jeollabukense]
MSQDTPLTEFQKLGTDRLACSAYGCCLHVDLLRKGKPEAVMESGDDQQSSHVPDSDYEPISDELFIPYRKPINIVGNHHEVYDWLRD